MSRLEEPQMLMLMQVQVQVEMRLGRMESLARSPVPVANLLFVDLCQLVLGSSCADRSSWLFVVVLYWVVALTGYGVAACCGGVATCCGRN